MLRLLALTLAFGACATLASAHSRHPPVRPPPPGPLPADARFADEINAFAAADRVSPPPACPILFVGSSSIRRWITLGRDLQPYVTLNRGFGGSEISDIDAYFNRVVAPYRPRAIVFYAGDNDIHAGKSADDVVADFRTFLDLKRKALGGTEVYFISIKPSPARLIEYPVQEDVNRKIKSMTLERHDLSFIDVTQDMMDGGKPKDIFVADGLHMTPEGYAIWTHDVRRVLDWTDAAHLKCRK